ncbi:hypothetical protein [Ralstonia flaminis]|jgi:hypothetical protein|uniref:hypothetical protein n=1 Tax=Ralstonia flaminis TaxID=3058597 RepID=UPI002931637B|nr:hypothetical protein [Ralstonia sp. LMG 18101]
MKKPSLGLMIAYLLLGLPASVLVGGTIAWLIARGFYRKDGQGYAWIWYAIFISIAVYVVCLVSLPFFRNNSKAMGWAVLVLFSLSLCLFIKL